MEYDRNGNGADYIISPVGRDYLEDCTDGDPMGYIIAQQEIATMSLFCMTQIARLLDHPGSTPLNIFPESREGRAFLSGEILGKAVLNRFLNPLSNTLAIRELTNFNPLVPTVAGAPYSAILARKSAILNKAGQGWDSAKPHYGELLSHWDSALTMSNSEPPCLRFGFGFIIKLGQEAWEEEVNSIYEEERLGSDMESELQRILDGGS